MQRFTIRQRLLAILLLPFLMVLAGCGKFHADFDIQDIDTINVSFDIAMDTMYAEGTWDSAEEFCSDAEGETGLDEDAPTIEPYEADGQYGCRISGVVTSDDFGSGLSLTEEDGEMHLTLDAGQSGTDVSQFEELGLDIDFRMAFTFPGEIIESSGGQIDGTTVTFTELSEVSNGIDIRAESGSSFPWVIVIVVVLVLGFLLLLLLAAVVFFVLRARKKKSASTPSGMPGGYGGGAAAGASPAVPPAPPGQQTQSPQWGQASPPPAAPQGSQWGQASPPQAPQQGEQPWSQPPQQGEQPWSQPPQQGEQPWSQPPQQGDQPWSQPPQQGDQPWSQPPQQGDQGQQPPRQPGW